MFVIDIEGSIDVSNMYQAICKVLHSALVFYGNCWDYRDEWARRFLWAEAPRYWGTVLVEWFNIVHKYFLGYENGEAPASPELVVNSREGDLYLAVLFAVGDNLYRRFHNNFAIGVCGTPA